MAKVVQVGAFLGFIALAAIVGLSTPDAPNGPRSEPADDDRSGLGMTYTGRIGIEISPGLVMTPNGIHLGFGL